MIFKIDETKYELVYSTDKVVVNKFKKTNSVLHKNTDKNVNSFTNHKLIKDQNVGFNHVYDSNSFKNPNQKLLNKKYSLKIKEISKFKRNTKTYCKELNNLVYLFMDKLQKKQTTLYTTVQI